MVAKIEDYLMTSDNIADVIVSALTFMGGAAGQKMFEAWRTRKEEKRKAKIEYSLSNMSEIYDAMSAVVQNTPATRFLIFRGSNGGGIPKPGHEFYASAVHERHKHQENERLTEKYKKIAVDAAYINMLLQVIATGSHRFIVDEMESSLLRNIYKSEGIHYVEIYFLAKTEKEVFYASIATDEVAERFTKESDRVEIDIALSRIRQVFKQYT